MWEGKRNSFFFFFFFSPELREVLLPEPSEASEGENREAAGSHSFQHQAKAEKVGAGDTASHQWLPHKHTELGSTPRTHTKMPRPLQTCMDSALERQKQTGKG